MICMTYTSVKQGGVALKLSARRVMRGSEAVGPSLAREVACSFRRPASFHRHAREVQVQMRGSWSNFDLENDGVPPDFQVELPRAVQLFNEGSYYAAHDVLEEMWHNSQDPQRAALHGVLQCAVGLHHLLGDNHRGCMIEFGEGLRKLDRLSYCGALSNFTSEAHQLLQFVYSTQLEYAACTQDYCNSMDGDDVSYDLLGDFAKGERLYCLEESFEDGVLRKRIVYCPPTLFEDNSSGQSVPVPVLNVSLYDLEAL
mmetsp:Transcript_40511/g.77390  ORF Transcript_40511/g.77390 Transcript_40511/m.77390 type:complete len:256 (+) Transcript_40511:138-905(+)